MSADDLIWWWGAGSLCILGVGSGCVLLAFFIDWAATYVVRHVSTVPLFLEWVWERKRGRIISEKRGSR